MKKIYNIGIAICIAILSSCSDFLEESSQDLIVPKTVTAYKEFFFGEGLRNGQFLLRQLDIMTDDTEDFVNLTNGETRDWRLDGWSSYTWQQDMEIGKNNAFTADKAWEEYYHRILIANIILNNIPTMEGEETEKTDLMGEAYFLRAWSYFMLANLYGAPYVDETRAKTDLCIPFNREIGLEDKSPARATVRQIYDQMEKDIRLSIDMFKKSGIEKTVFRPNLSTSYLLASRIMLFQKKHDQTIAYADSVLSNTKGSLQDLNTYKETSFLSINNPEILFSFGSSPATGFEVNNLAYYLRSASLMNIFDPSDQRLKFYFDAKTKKPLKFKNGKVFEQAFRLTEVYLNRAEARAEKGDLPGATADLLLVRKNRLSKNTEITLENQSAAITAVRNERRREFCFEGFRWFDLRRWDRPRIEHRWTSELKPSEFITYVLEKDDAAYTLQIPKKERDKNANIELWNRPDRKGSK